MLTNNVRKMLLPRFIALGCLLLWFLPQNGIGQLLKDGSFEVVNPNGTGYNGWQFCQGAPDIQVLDGFGAGIFGINTPAANGQHYLGMIDSQFESYEAIGQAFRIEAGTHFYGSVALFTSHQHQNWDGKGQLQIWGGDDCEQPQELLWTSGTVENVDEWAYYSVEFAATSNHSWISLRVALDAGSGGMTYICLDDLRLDNEFLAVDYLSFDALPQGDHVQLNWETPSLIENQNFLVEWSTDGQTFMEVGQVNGIAGESRFASSHFPTAAGLQYYRIQALDRSGNVNLSEVRQATWNLGNRLQVYPNPAQTHFSITSGQPMQSIVLVDMNGRAIMDLAIDDSQFVEITLPSNLPRSCYELLVQTKTERLRHRIIVQ